MTPARPMLPGAFAVLTDLPSGLWRGWISRPFSLSAAGVVRHGHASWEGDVVIRWITPDPAEAYEVLQTRGLIPDDYCGAFVCVQCDGSGIRDRLVDAECLDCDGTGHRPHPASLPDLVAWASLGFGAHAGGPGILGMEEIVRCDGYYAPLAWSVGTIFIDSMPAGRIRNQLFRSGCDVMETPTLNTLIVPSLNNGASATSEGP